MQREPRTANCPVLPHSPVPASHQPSSEPPTRPLAPVADPEDTVNTVDTVDTAALPKPRGFQLMSQQQHRLIASRGGKTAHAKGLAHEYTAEEALLAGRKGGAVVSRDRAHMAKIGRKGGLARGRYRDKQASTTAPLAS